MLRVGYFIRSTHYGFYYIPGDLTIEITEIFPNGYEDSVGEQIPVYEDKILSQNEFQVQCEEWLKK